MPERPAHHGSRGFRNPHHRGGHGGWALAKFLAAWARTPPSGSPPVPVRPDRAFLRGNRSQRTATWVGHATWLIQLDGINVLTDPHLSPRASPVAFAGPERLIPPALTHTDLPQIDVVLVSHNHYDHWDTPTLRWLVEAHGPQFFVPLGDAARLRRLGTERVAELDWWASLKRGGIRVTAVPAQHFSGRGLADRNRSLWCGYVFEAEGAKVYFAGDTGYSPDFTAIGQRFAPIDLALLPIGAYEPRGFMAPMHVNPEEAVRIHQEVGARRSLAMHWGTFRLTLEPVDEPPRRLQDALAAAAVPGAAFQAPRPGETVFW